VHVLSVFRMYVPWTELAQVVDVSPVRTYSYRVKEMIRAYKAFECERIGFLCFQL